MFLIQTTTSDNEYESLRFISDNPGNVLHLESLVTRVSGTPLARTRCNIFSSNLYRTVISHFTPADFPIPWETSLMGFWSLSTNHIFPFMFIDKNTLLLLSSVQFKEITNTLNFIWALASHSLCGSEGYGLVSCFLWVLKLYLCLYSCFLEFCGEERSQSPGWDVCQTLGCLSGPGMSVRPWNVLISNSRPWNVGCLATPGIFVVSGMLLSPKPGPFSICLPEVGCSFHFRMSNF